MIDDPISDLSPAMRACNERQRRFARGFVMEGLSQIAAARAAGYSEKTATHHAHEIFRHPKVQAAMAEMSHTLLILEVPRCIRTLEQIRDNERASADVCVTAALGLLDRAGFGAPHNSHVNVIGADVPARTEKDLNAGMADLLRSFGCSDTTIADYLARHGESP